MVVTFFLIFDGGMELIQITRKSVHSCENRKKRAVSMYKCGGPVWAEPIKCSLKMVSMTTHGIMELIQIHKTKYLHGYKK